MLLEQEGAWGPDALAESQVPKAVARELQARARRHGFRVLLLRRGAPADGPSRRCFIAYSGPRDRWMEEGSLTAADLLDLDLRGLRHGERVGFAPLRPGPLYLVCTNGRHDPCCAQFGRPVARALQQALGESVWECSHVGGDRFAGNLVCLPDGLYFGCLGPAGALAVVAGHQRGLLDLDHYRGRSCHPFPVQSAEFFLRRAEGLTGIDDVVVEHHEALGAGVVEVRLGVRGGRRFDVRVQVAVAAEGRPLTCHATVAARPATYSLLSLTPGDGGRLA